MKVADLANQIHVWQLASNVNQKSSSKKPGNILDEFGSNLSFQVPAASSDEFEDISDDDEDDWDDLGINSSLEDTAIVASSAVSQQTDGSASMPHKGEWPSSTSNGVGGITLRWYYEACEQASHGQFSGSELAMALYRVLDSERSEDEVRIPLDIYFELS